MPSELEGRGVGVVLERGALSSRQNSNGGCGVAGQSVEATLAWSKHPPKRTSSTRHARRGRRGARAATSASPARPASAAARSPLPASRTENPAATSRDALHGAAGGRAAQPVAQQLNQHIRCRCGCAGPHVCRSFSLCLLTERAFHPGPLCSRWGTQRAPWQHNRRAARAPPFAPTWGGSDRARVCRACMSQRANAADDGGA